MWEEVPFQKLFLIRKKSNDSSAIIIVNVIFFCKDCFQIKNLKIRDVDKFSFQGF